MATLPEAQLFSATQDAVSRTNTTGFMLPHARSRKIAPTALASGAAAMARCTSVSSGCTQSMTKCVMPAKVTRAACTSAQPAGCTDSGSGITVDAVPSAVSAMTGWTPSAPLISAKTQLFPCAPLRSA